MKDPAIRRCLLQIGVMCDVEHLSEQYWLVLAQPGPAWPLRGHVIAVKRSRRELIATADLGKPH